MYSEVDIRVKLVNILPCTVTDFVYTVSASEIYSFSMYLVLNKYSIVENSHHGKWLPLNVRVTLSYARLEPG